MFGFLVVSWALSFGFVPQQYNAIMDASGTEHYYQAVAELPEDKVTTWASLKLSATAFNIVRVYTDIKSYQYARSLLEYQPCRADYTIGAEVFLGDNVTLVAEHTCIHPIAWRTNLSYDALLENGAYFASETKLYISVHGKTVF